MSIQSTLEEILKSKEIEGLVQVGGVGAVGSYARFDIFVLHDSEMFVGEVQVAAALAGERAVLKQAIEERAAALRAFIEEQHAAKRKQAEEKAAQEPAPGIDLTQITGFDTIKGALQYTQEEPPLPSGNEREGKEPKKRTR